MATIRTTSSSQEQESRAEKNRQALLTSEATLLALLLSQTRGAITAQQFERGTAGAVIAGRSLARSNARSVVLSDLAALGATPGGLGTLVDVAVADAARAVQAAKGIGQRALTALRGGESAAATRAGLRPALELVAATEGADAYNGERGRIAAGAGSIVRIMKVWDAVLDKRTCPTCASLDGTVVGLGERFPVEQPAHPRCRCTFTMLRSDEIDGEAVIQPIARR